MSSLIPKLDFFGPLTNFQFNESPRHQTKQGAILTLIVFIISLVLSILFGQEVFKREKPRVVVGEELYTNPKIYLKNFPIMYRFTNEVSEDIIAEHFIVFYVNLIIISPNGKEIFNNIGLEDCRKRLDFFEGKTKEIVASTLQTAQGNLFYCPKFKQVDYFSVYEPSSFYVNIMFGFCTPWKTRPITNEHCRYKNPNYQLENNKNFKVITYYLNSLVSPTKYEHFIESSIVPNKLLVSEGLVKIQRYNIMEGIFETDNGWLLSSLKTETFYKVDKIDKELIFGVNQFNSFYVDTFYGSKTRQKYFRSYLKIQELFANVGGIVNAIVIFFNILSLHYLKYLYLVFVYEATIKNSITQQGKSEGQDVSNIKPNKLINFIISKSKSNNNSSIPLNIQNQFQENPIKLAEDIAIRAKNNDCLDLIQIHQYFAKNQISYFCYLQSLFCRCFITNEKQNSYTNLFKQITEIVDIKTLVEVLYQIYSLKEFNQA